MKGYKTHILRWLSASAMMLATLVVEAQIPEGYYASLKGKSGEQLKTAIHEVIKKASVLSYGSGEDRTWSGFYKTDRNADNSCIDRYSTNVRYFTSETSAPSGMNIEHSFPKSWWGGDENQAYKDLYNLMPSDSKANSAKSNYPMGEVSGTATYDNGAVKIGQGTNGSKVWEPIDKWKGDFSRGMMYMATAYQDFTWKGDMYPNILQQGAYPTLKQWAYTLYIKWAKADKVDEIEIKRNDAVCKIQGNRNPYVDFPNLMEYVWGDSIGTPFNPETTVKSANYVNGNGGGTGGGDTEQPIEMTIYSELFTQTAGDCAIEDIVAPSTSFDVWTRSTRYGWVGTGYYNNVRYAVESVLKTPELDLTNYDAATMVVNQAVNYCNGLSPQDYLSIEVLCDGTTTVLSGFTWPVGTNWDFVETGTINLDAFAGKKITVLFRYTSTTSLTPTWEIQKMTVKASKNPSGIEEVVEKTADKPDFMKPYDAYTLDGRKISGPISAGIIVVRQGGKTYKIMR